MKRKKLRRGRKYEVTFLDHAHNTSDNKPIKARVYGRCHRVDKTSLTLDHWIEVGTSERAPKDNTETITLVRSAVLSVREAQFGRPFRLD